MPGGKTVSSILTWLALLSGHLHIALLRLFLMHISIRALILSCLLVFFYHLSSSKYYKNFSFGVVLGDVGRFLNSYCDGFFSQKSSRRGIPPLSINCAVIRWCI